jgi:hypothetical protein
MTTLACRALKMFLTLVLAASLAAPANLRAGDHVISAADIRKAIQAQTVGRQENLSRVQRFFTSSQASRALAGVPAVRARIVRAVAQLDDQELARMAARVDKTQRDFAAGALNNQQLTYIIIALATAVIVLILVET